MNEKRIALAFCLFIAAAAVTFGESGPKILKYSEVIDLSSNAPVVRVEAECVSAPDGSIYLPGKGKLVVKEIAAQGASVLNGAGDTVKMNDLTYLALKTEKPNAAITVSILYDAKDVLKAKEAKLGTTFPGGVYNYARAFVNTTPLDIKNFTASLLLPEGSEIYRVVKPAKAESYQLTAREGKACVVTESSTVKAGGSSELSVDTYRRPRTAPLLVWGVVAVISILVLILRRGALRSDPS